MVTKFGQELLLQNENGDLSKMVSACGSKVEEKLRQIALEAHQRRHGI